jgi:chromosomal replication initiator protein
MVLRVIADRIPTNVRALEGALIRVRRLRVAHGAPAHLLGGPRRSSRASTRVPARAPGRPRRCPGDRARISLEGIVQLVCVTFSVTPDELVSTARTARIAWPRQLAMYLAREHTDASLPVIGRHFGGRSHTTVMYALRRTSERLAADAEALDTAQALSRRLRAGSVPGRPPGSDRRP